MSRRGYRVRRWRGLLALMLVWLSACTQIPTSGPIEEVPVPDDPAGIEIAPQPPRGGDQPRQIVEGFLLALADPDSDHEVARAYLARGVSEHWHPRASTRIYEGTVVDRGDGAVLRGRVVGELEMTGRFVQDGAQLEHDFGLTMEDGQWRIAQPPEGVLISRYLFDRFYSRVNMYFMDPTGRHVVPDLITVPTTALTPERIVRAQLTGPSHHLVPVVSNAVPVDATLASDGATIDADGVVTVAFKGLDPNMDAEQRRRFGAQLLWSLTAVPRTTGLKVTNDGWPFALPGQSAAGVLELATQQGYSVLAQSTVQDLFAIIDGHPGTLGDEDRFVPLMSDPPQVVDMAVSLNGQDVVLAGDDRRTLWIRRGQGQWTKVASGLQGVRSLHWVLGTVYGLGETDAGETRVLMVSPNGEVHHPTVSVPRGLRLHHMTINPAGAQAAVIAGDGRQHTLGWMTLTVAGSLASWRPLSIISPQGTDVADITDIEWNSESTLVVVGESDGRQGIYVVRADGSEVEELTAVEDTVVDIAALPRQGGGLIALGGEAGTLWRYNAPNRWSRSDIGIARIVYPG